MPILGIIAAGISGHLTVFTENFTAQTNLPLTSTFNAISHGFTDGVVYWGGGRDESTATFYSFYSRTTTSGTWTYKNAKPNQGQARANAYPIGSTNKWFQCGGEYGGALDDVQSMVYNGNWVSETNYPILIHYNGMGAIQNTKIGYSIAGGQPSSVFITAVYSHTGTGSWISQTNYPVNCTEIQGRTVGLPTKVVVVGGITTASALLSLVYSYTGSGAWVAETSFPSGAVHGQSRAVYSNTTAKVYVYTPATTDFYYWTGSGAWTNGGTRSAITSTNNKSIAAVGDHIFLLGGDYRNGRASCDKAIVS